MITHCQFALPDDFRREDLLRYHLRDESGQSEAWHEGALLKGMSWNGQAARLRVQLDDGMLRASMDVAGDGPDAAALETLMRHMSGLDQDIAGFERAVAGHDRLGPLVQAQRGLRVAVTATPFEALSWAILGQQISVKAAAAIRHRFIATANLRHDSGLLCHPDAAGVLAIPTQDLLTAGLSRTKAITLQAVSRAVVDDVLPLDDWLRTLPVEAMQSRLLEQRGIGPWTASYTLLRGYGWLDGSLHGDVAVRNALGTLLGMDAAASPAQTQEWLAGFTPWRALAAAHLWASRALQA